MDDRVEYYDRATGELKQESVLGEKWIRWAYQDGRSPLIAKLLFGSSMISGIFGAWYDTSFSRPKIGRAIEELGIDSNEFLEPVDRYSSFNEFFIRKLKPGSRPYDSSPSRLVSPADGRVLVYPKLEDGFAVPVKGKRFSVEQLLGRPCPEYAGGDLAVIRLCPADYHRYHFPCAGRISEVKQIKGFLHSVNPIALAKNIDVFAENKREYTTIDSVVFGKVCFMEVGAFGVGSIVQTYEGESVEKMDEKGYFKFGGSTVILVFEPSKIAFSDDLVKHSAEGIETLVKVGETIATNLD